MEREGPGGRKARKRCAKSAGGRQPSECVGVPASRGCSLHTSCPLRQRDLQHQPARMKKKKEAPSLSAARPRQPPGHDAGRPKAIALVHAGNRTYQRHFGRAALTCYFPDPCHCKRPSPISTIYAFLLFLLGRSLSGDCDKRKKKIRFLAHSDGPTTRH
jgi:hypothetical protein